MACLFTKLGSFWGVNVAKYARQLSINFDPSPEMTVPLNDPMDREWPIFFANLFGTRWAKSRWNIGPLQMAENQWVSLGLTHTYKWSEKTTYL